MSVSFGSARHDTAAAEINKALEKVGNMIVFAAASNAGKNKLRTFPATSSRVIGIHAMSGLGEVWPNNPTTTGEYDNFGTLGLGIKLWWKCDNVYKEEYKNGTSYATPVAAGIAANWLDWLQSVANDSGCDLTEMERTRWSSADGIRSIFTRVMSEEHGGLRYVAPWHLFDLDKDLTDAHVVGRLKATRGL